MELSRVELCEQARKRLLAEVVNYNDYPKKEKDGKFVLALITTSGKWGEIQKFSAIINTDGQGTLKLLQMASFFFMRRVIIRREKVESRG